MKRSQLRKLVLEAMAGGFEPDGEGNLVPHYDKFDSTKLSRIFMDLLRRKTQGGDAEEGERVLTQKSNPENVARILRGEKPIYEADGQLYSKDDAIAYIENNRGAKYYNIGVSQGVTQRATDPVKAIKIVRDSPISKFVLTTYGQTIQFSAPYDEKHGDAVRAMGGLD